MTPFPAASSRTLNLGSGLCASLPRQRPSSSGQPDLGAGWGSRDRLTSYLSLASATRASRRTQGKVPSQVECAYLPLSYQTGLLVPDSTFRSPTSTSLGYKSSLKSHPWLPQKALLPREAA